MMTQYEQNISSFLKDFAEEEIRKGNSTAEDSIRNYNNFFNNIILPEMKQLDKCISRFSEQEIVNIFAGRKLSFSTARRYFGYIQDYLTWLMNRDFDSTSEDRFTTMDFENHPMIYKKENESWYDFYSLIHRQEGESFSRQYFKSEEQFVGYVEEIFSSKATKTEDNTRYDTSKVIHYLIWLGLSVQDILTLTDADFDFTNKTVKAIPVNNETIWSFLMYYRTTTYYNRLNKNGTFSPKEYLDGSLFIKSGFSEINKRFITLATDNAKKLCTQLPVSSRYYKTSYPIKNIQKSGVFCRLYNQEDKYSLTPTQLRKALIKEMNLSENSSGAIRGVYREYIDWKNNI